MSSTSSLVSSSRRIREGENTGMNLGLQLLEERIIATTTTTTTTTTCNNTTQLRVRSISDSIGCDITIKDIQTAKQELINQKFDLKKDVNNRQDSSIFIGTTPMIHFCWTGDLLIIKLLFLIGANCTKLCKYRRMFPMLVAAQSGHVDICKWLFEYGGDAKYQINKETSGGNTPLRLAYHVWHWGSYKESKTCRWLLQNGGGQNLSSKAMKLFIGVLGPGKCREEETRSNFLIMWMRKNIQLHDTFILFLCGAATMITSSSSSSLSSEPDDGGTRKRKHNHPRERKRHRERSLQILDGHPGIMEVIGNYVGVIRAKELRMLQEFNELVIEYIADELA